MHKVTPRHFIIATAGHVDHGKSALVKALTGTDPDRLPEEKKRQITIDLGFAELNLTGPDEQKFQIGIVDVPGHEDFVRNMIAGVGSIDLALVAVAADDGWMPQTEEHLQILNYLAVQRAVIALTKCDLGKADIVAEEIRDRLRGTAFAASPIIPTSVRTGEGIENLKSTLSLQFITVQAQRDFGKPRLFIDRAFTLRGIGTVVTGTLTGGRLYRGQSIVAQPKNLEARIRSIQSHGAEINCAQPAMRTAVNLPDVGIGDSWGEIKRGDVISVVDLGTATSSLIALLEKSPRLNPENPAARPLKDGFSAYVYHGTSRVAAKIAFLEDGYLGPGDKKIVRLKVASPIFVFSGDRFVIRDPSEQYTIAGGMVLDPDGGNTKFRDEQKRSLLMERAMGPDDIDLWIRSEIALRRCVSRKTLLNKSHFSVGEIAEAIMRLQHDNQILLRQEIVAEREFWQRLRQQASTLIDEMHKRSPQRVGLALTELRAALLDQSQNVFEALIADLCTGDFVRVGSVIARATHRPMLPADLQPVEVKIRESLSQKPFDPPARREIETDRDVRQVLRFLIESGEIIEIASDVVLLRTNFELMKSGIIDFIAEHGPATVSDLRQALRSSRRITVPFLERLDRDGVTRRLGDKRILAA
jgi:selenocysteine-specific elongation factor